MLLAQAVLVVASVRIVAFLNATAVVVEVAIVGVMAIALIVVVVVTGHGSVENLTSRGVSAGSSNYFGAGGGLMLATIMGLATLVGFDAAANLAEEAKDPYRTVPRAIIGSVVAAAVLGMVFLIALTVSITNIKKISLTDGVRGGDHARSARSGGREDPAGGRHLLVLRRRDGDHGNRRTAGVRDGARRAFSV